MSEAKEEPKYGCYVCGKDVEGYKPQMCCDGRECGCYGMPLEPPICSNECWDKLTERGQN